MKRILLFCVFAVSVSGVFAQAPQKFNYQAVARNSSGDVLAEQAITVRLAIFQSNVKVWQEEHPVVTNSLGQFALQVGGPEALNGTGSAGTFSGIDWSSGVYEMGIEIDEGNGFIALGTNELLSVPFALHAANGTKWETAGENIITAQPVEIYTNTNQTETPLFEVRNDAGNPVFAVFNDGVMVYVDEEKKGAKGGFAVGGYNTAKKTVTQEFLRITPDSVRIYVPDDPAAKGVKGGFAVGGYNKSKGITDNYLEIKRASTSIYFDSTSSRKGVKGGFAVGGYNSGKAGEPNQMMALTRENYFIGDEAGAAITRGRFNTFFGYKSGKSTTAGYRNVFLGYWTGTNNTTGANNVFIGNESGAFNVEGMNNVFLGTAAGRSNSAGNRNVFIGNESGISNTRGYENVFIGNIAGRSNATGFSNIFIGSGAGFSNSSGSGNIMLGRVAGYSGTEHSNNIFLGDSSGYFTDNQFATKNVFIGYAAGKNTQSYNNVFIGNRAGYQNSSGQNNIAIGDLAGLNNTSSQNIFIGTQAGMNNTDGFFNIIMGRYAGRNNTTGSHQVIIGGGAGSSMTTGQRNLILGGVAGSLNETGSNNVYLGYGAGWSNTGSGNIFIGYRSGYGVHQDVSDKLIISNYSAAEPLIMGDFTGNGLLEIHGNLEVDNGNFRIQDDPGTGTTPAYYVYQGGVAGSTSKQYAFTVHDYLWVTRDATFDGSIYANENVYANGVLLSSDERYKQQVEPIGNALFLVEQLNGVYFNWKTEDFEHRGFDNSRQIGFIAQEVEAILPELVATDEDGYKSVDYSKVTAVLIQAVKEQQAEIEQLKAENEKYAALDEKIRILEEKLTILDNLTKK